MNLGAPFLNIVKPQTCRGLRAAAAARRLTASGAARSIANTRTHPIPHVQYRRTVCSLYVHTIRQIMLLLTYEMSNEFKSISSCAASSATTVGT